HSVEGWIVDARLTGLWRWPRLSARQRGGRLTAPTEPAGQHLHHRLVVQRVGRVVLSSSADVRLPVPPVDAAEPGNAAPDLNGRINRAPLDAEVEHICLLRL